jgi:hypothetical protein
VTTKGVQAQVMATYHAWERGERRKMEATVLHKPATRTQTSINKKSETAGRGAKKLATPNVQEVSY